MKNFKFYAVGALSCGFTALAIVPAFSQPLPLERAIPQINNLSLKEVTPEEAEKLVMPAKGISLRFQDATLTEALDELQKQSGVKLDYGWADQKTLDKKLSLDMETPYFMPALDAILDEAGVKASLQNAGFGSSYRVQFGQTDGDKVAPLLSGTAPFQVRLESVQSNFGQTVRVSADKKDVRSENRQFSINLNGKTDPITNIVGSPLIIIKRVEDDKGRSLLDTNANRWMRYSFDNFGMGSRSQNIQKPAADAKSLARVEGTAIYVVASARQKWEIADILNNKDATHEFESGGRTITFHVKSAARLDDAISLNIEVSAPPRANNNGGETDPLLAFGQMSKAFTLQDANGNVFRTNGYSGSGGGEKMSMSGQFTLSRPRGPRGDGQMPVPQPAIVEPIKLVFDAPTEWVQTAVPFSFSDVPLP